MKNNQGVQHKSSFVANTFCCSIGSGTQPYQHLHTNTQAHLIPLDNPLCRHSTKTQERTQQNSPCTPENKKTTRTQQICGSKAFCTSSPKVNCMLKTSTKPRMKHWLAIQQKDLHSLKASKQEGKGVLDFQKDPVQTCFPLDGGPYFDENYPRKKTPRTAMFVSRR